MSNIFDNPQLFEAVKTESNYKTIIFYHTNPNDPDDLIEIPFEYREINQQEYLSAMKISEKKSKKGGTRSRKNETDELSVDDFGKRQNFIFNTCIRNWQFVDLDPSEVSMSDNYDPPRYSIWMLTPSQANQLMERIVPTLEETEDKDVLGFLCRDRTSSARTEDKTKRSDKIKPI